jgi:hypothetical protein
MTADLSERDRIRAAMNRILDGTPERSNGALTVVALAIEAGVPRNALTQPHTDLKDEFYQRIRDRGAGNEDEAGSAPPSRSSGRRSPARTGNSPGSARTSPRSSAPSASSPWNCRKPGPDSPHSATSPGSTAGVSPPGKGTISEGHAHPRRRAAKGGGPAQRRRPRFMNSIRALIGTDCAERLWITDRWGSLAGRGQRVHGKAG